MDEQSAVSHEGYAIELASRGARVVVNDMTRNVKYADDQVDRESSTG
jgi:hypothetical protein